MLTDLKHPRHRQSSPDPIFSKPAQCRHVVCQDNALLVSRPCEQVRIIDARETNVLNSDQIQCWTLAEQAAEDRAVDSRRRRIVASGGLPAARQEALTNAIRVMKPVLKGVDGC